MVQLGCNYSQPLLSLLAAGEVAVDWIKLSRDDTLEQEIAECRPVRPCLVHTLPLDRVAEIHVAGIRTMADGERNDSHGVLAEEDYSLRGMLP